MLPCKVVNSWTYANLHNAMDVHQSKCSGLSLFSRGRCQVLLKSATKKNRFFLREGGRLYTG